MFVRRADKRKRKRAASRVNGLACFSTSMAIATEHLNRELRFPPFKRRYGCSALIQADLLLMVLCQSGGLKMLAALTLTFALGSAPESGIIERADSRVVVEPFQLIRRGMSLEQVKRTLPIQPTTTTITLRALVNVGGGFDCIPRIVSFDRSRVAVTIISGKVVLVERRK